MVKMDNIKRTENIISLDCYAEGDRQQHFYLEIDATSFEILVNSYNEMNPYVFHAQQKIREYVLAEDNLPAEALSMWC